MTARLRVQWAAALQPYLATYREFKGSLTSPPCSEDVTWIVLDEAISTRPDDLAYLALQVSAPPDWSSTGQTLPNTGQTLVKHWPNTGQTMVRRPGTPRCSRPHHTGQYQVGDNLMSDQCLAPCQVGPWFVLAGSPTSCTRTVNEGTTALR